MCRMISSVRALTQHSLTLNIDPSAYKPERCPQCGVAGLWAHGVYYRKGDRSVASANQSVLIPIPRFCCPHCGATCSCLPACLSPRRWYPWSAQELALLLALAGTPLTCIRKWVSASVDTIRRWRAWLAERTGTFEFHLRSVFKNLGHHDRTDAFWLDVLRKPGLSKAMDAVCHQRVVVP
uniref:DUF6431 domain-containing protein n=1 Tax=Candidatus Kentrum sp. DK TaxID=2126562 RepID=A0A450S3B6_9GAMM|nr:MAG: hypothetical protein BECKDK2373B_GA0170837_101243 [Candidatus Kentron sp. DK]